MSFISRMGTDQIHFNVSIHLQKMVLNINAECLVFIMFIRGDKKVQSRQLAHLENRVAIFNETLEMPVTLYQDRKTKKFNEKFGVLHVLLQGAKGIKKAGEVPLEFSTYLNSGQPIASEKLIIEKCPDPKAHIQITVILNQIGTQVTQMMQQQNNQIQRVVQETVGDRNMQLLNRIDQDEIIETFKSDQMKFKKSNLKASQERYNDEDKFVEEKKIQQKPKTQQAKNQKEVIVESESGDDQNKFVKKPKFLIEREKSVKKSMINQKKDFDLAPTKIETNKVKLSVQNSQDRGVLSFNSDQESNQELITQLREDMKYLNIENGQLKNKLAKSNTKNDTLNDELNQMKERNKELMKNKNVEDYNNLKEQIKQQQSKIEQMTDKEQKLLVISQDQAGIILNLRTMIKSIQDEQPNTLLKDLQDENEGLKAKLKDVVNLFEEKIKKKQTLPTEQLEQLLKENHNLQAKVSDLEDENDNLKRLGTMSIIDEQPKDLEKEIARLSVENEHLKRKVRDQADDFEQKLIKLQNDNEEEMRQHISSVDYELQSLRQFKYKYDDINEHWEKMQEDLQQLRIQKFELDDRLQQHDLKYSQLETDYLKFKQSMAGAMSAFLEYGDDKVIEIMEYYIT